MNVARSTRTTPANGIGHNMPPELDQETFLSAVRTMDAFVEKRKELNAQISRFRKDLRTRGIKLGTFDAVLSLRELERDEQREDLIQQVQFRRWLNLPVGSQAEMFPRGAPKPVESSAFAAGFSAGVSGKDRQAPEEFAKEKRDWNRGWDDGQRKLGADIFGAKDYSADESEDAEAEGPAAAQEEKPKRRRAAVDPDEMPA